MRFRFLSRGKIVVWLTAVMFTAAGSLAETDAERTARFEAESKAFDREIRPVEKSGCKEYWSSDNRRSIERVINACTKALQRTNWTTRQRGYVFHVRGAASAVGDKLPEALADLDQAITLNPGYAPSYLKRGYVHYRLGRPALSHADFQKAVELGSKRAEYPFKRSRDACPSLKWEGKTCVTSDQPRPSAPSSTVSAAPTLPPALAPASASSANSTQPAAQEKPGWFSWLWGSKKPAVEQSPPPQSSVAAASPPAAQSTLPAAPAPSASFLSDLKARDFNLPPMSEEERIRLKKSVYWYPDRPAPGTSEKDLRACHRGEKLEAIAACTRLIDSKAYQGRELAAIYAWRSDGHAGTQRFDLAMKDAEEAKRIDPESAVAAGSHELADRWMKNVARFEAAMTVDLNEDPHNVEALVHRAIWREMKGDHNAALADVSILIRLDPKKASRYAWRCELQWRLGRYPEAVADCSKALELDPKDRGPYGVRGLASIMTAKSTLELAAASEDINIALALPQIEKAVKIAMIDFRAWAWSDFGNSNAAIRDYRSILRLDAENKNALDMLKRLGGLTTLDPDSDRCTLEPDDGRRIAACTALIAWLQGHDRAAALFQRGRTSPVPVAGEQAVFDTYKQKLKDIDSALDLAPDIIDFHYVRALFSEEVGDDVAARRHYDKLIELAPAIPGMHYKRHMFLLGIGDIDGARADLAAALKLAPASDVYKRQLDEFARNSPAGRLRNVFECTTNTNTRPPERTIQFCSRAINAGQGSTRSRLLRGLAYSRLNEVDKAIADFSEIIRVEPNHVQALELRGLYHAQAKNWASALADFDALAKAAPLSDDAHRKRAMALAALGRNNEAAEAAAKALAINPNNAQAKELQIALAGGSGEGPCWQAADLNAQFTECTKIIGNSSERAERRSAAYAIRGQVHHMRNQPKEAIADFNQAISLNGNLTAYGLRGVVTAQYSLDDKGALADLTKAIEGGINIPRVSLMRGIILRNRGDIAALADFAREIERFPSAGAFGERATTYYALAKYKEAEADLRSALSQTPIAGPLKAQLIAIRGAIAEKKGDPQGARDDYRTALGLDPTNALALQRLKALGSP
ncbi:MAG: tetratricopeptide repeat protein [Hyphomicrobiaceae bacterium]